MCAIQALARMVTDDIRAEGGIYPEFNDMRSIRCVGVYSTEAKRFCKALVDSEHSCRTQLLL